MAIKKVTLLGADGKLGPAILQALLSNGFKMTVLKRSSSKSPDAYPPNVEVAKVSDDFPIDAVANTLKGQDALIATIKGKQVELQDNLAQACVKAGVQRFIPADFGSVDSSSQKAQELVPLFKRKTELRERLTTLSEKNNSFSWTALVCGHFFDWSTEFLHIWIKERRADILDDGEVRWSASTLSRIGEATARILLNPEATRNKMVYVQSFCVSQNQVIKAFENATGSSWQITRFNSDQYEAEEKKKADDGDLESVENLVWLLGALEANWESKENFMMETFGLKDEDLETVVKRVVDGSSDA